MILLQEIEPHEWYHVAVTFDHGLYIVYLNGDPVYEKITDYDLVRTHTHTTLGYVEQDLFFRGCMDDVSCITKCSLITSNN